MRELIVSAIAAAVLCAACAGGGTPRADSRKPAPAALPDTAALEQRFADLAFELELSDDAARQRGAREYLRRSADEPGGLALAAEIADRYLFDPESPVYSEALYIPFLEYLISTGRDSTGLLGEKLAICRRNAPGTKAPDFSYATPGGGRERLLKPGTAADIILFFHDPDCPRCRTFAEAMRTSEAIDRRIAEGTLRIAAVDLSLNSSVEADTLYEIRATPSVYLLRADGTVVLKEPSPQRLDIEFSARTDN